MIKGINNQPYIDMTSYLDMDAFDKMQPEIYKGFAEARMFAKEGTWMAPGFTFEKMSYMKSLRDIIASSLTQEPTSPLRSI